MFTNTLWRENDAYISFRDSYGFNQLKEITKTDLSTSLRKAKNTNDFSEHIDEGGKLHTLTALH